MAMIGKNISHYKILEKLGEGGMGIVYKAEDLKLKRIVALKFLPQHITSTADEQARFLQEAQAAATLNHPNICTIHAIEEHDGKQFIDMEFIDGSILRQKIPVKNVSEVITFAIQIGEALQEAHSKGIVHRDIKADNIMVNTNGQIKVMDFGLAKLKGSMKLTRTSSTVGTLAYMAPEQIQGGDVDARSDIFSFGVLLFEMLTGKLPFRGEHEAAMMYSIVNEEPESALVLRPDLTPEILHIITAALEKNPDERYQSASEIIRDLRRFQKQSTKVSRKSLAEMPVMKPESLTSTAHTPEVQQPPSSFAAAKISRHFPIWKAGLAIAVIAVIGLLAYLAFFRGSEGHEIKAPLQARFNQLTDQAGAELYPDISPDGSFIIYSRVEGDHSNIYLQRRNGGNPINLTKETETDNLEGTFSPDGQWIAFRSSREGGGIFIMGATGESVRRLADIGFNPTWSRDGLQIAVATEDIELPFGRRTVSSIWIINISTGEKRQISKGDGVQPSWSPHGKRIAYWGLPIGSGQRDIWTIGIEREDTVRLMNDVALDWNPTWSPDGKFIYFSSDRGGSLNLWRIPIDEESGKALGSPEPITTPSRMSIQMNISDDGKHIVYAAAERRSNIFSVDFDPVNFSVRSQPKALTEGSKQFDSHSASPDGKWLVCRGTSGPQEDLFVMKADGSELRQLTNDIYRDRGPRWSSDGKKICFYSNRTGSYEAWSINVDGSGLEQISTTASRSAFFLGDGRHAVVGLADSGSGLIDLTKPLNERTMVLFPPVDSSGNRFAPTDYSLDGKWLCGVRVNSKKPAPNGILIYSLAAKTYEVLSDTGNAPLWLHDNRHMIYNRGNNNWCVLDMITKHSKPITNLPKGIVLGKPPADNSKLYYFDVRTESDIWEAVLE
jgi:eukaryotic-like serine/threonine-protein kinase